MRSRAPRNSPDDLLARVERVVRDGLPASDVERRSDVARGFISEARRGGRRGPRSAASWEKIRYFLEAWEPLLGPEEAPRRRPRAPSTPATRPGLRKPRGPTVTIVRAFTDFLVDEQARGVSLRGLEQHARGFALLQGHLERYAEDDDAVNSEADPFVARHGPDRLLGEYYMFFTYYLAQKVLCSKSTIKSVGSSAARFARWLGSKGFVDVDEAEEAAELARYQARELLEDLAGQDIEPWH